MIYPSDKESLSTALSATVNLADADDAVSEKYRLHHDLDNPSRNALVHVQPPCVPYTQALKAEMRHGCSPHFVCKSLWILLHAVAAVWIYFFVKNSVHPVPRTVVNRTEASFIAFEVLMAVFSGCLAICDVIVLVKYVAAAHKDWRQARVTGYDDPFPWIQWFIVAPISLFVVLILTGGPWVIRIIAQRYAWNHGCDYYPMYAILDGKATVDSSTLNLAYFYEHGNSNPLFTYQLAEVPDVDEWGFSIRDWNTPQGAISREKYPTLQHIAYDYSLSVVDGNCTVPTTTSPDDTTVTNVPCLRGSFDDRSAQLTLNITSTVPLNDTSAETSAPAITSVLRTRDNPWYFSRHAPSLILDWVDSISGKPLAEILHTTVTKVGDCAQLKVCLTGTGREGHGGLVVGEMLAPLGLILKRQGEYAKDAKCAK